MDKSHPFNRFNINQDISDFYIWREFNDRFEKAMTHAENWWILTKMMASPKDLVTAFGLPIPSNHYFLRSSGAFCKKNKIYLAFLSSI